MSCLQFVENFKAVSSVRQSLIKQLSEFPLASVRFLSRPLSAFCQAFINDQYRVVGVVFKYIDWKPFYSCFLSFLGSNGNKTICS